MPTEVIVDYGVPGASGPLSVFYFDSVALVSQARIALDEMFTDMASLISSSCSWVVRTSGRVLNDNTGALMSEWNDAVPSSGQGTSTAPAAANATSILLRWATGDVVNGRFVKGRTYVPGFAQNLFFNGGLSAAAVGTASNAGQSLCDAGVGFGVWHRPTNGVGGSFHEAVAATAWNELAVQRGRR